MNPFVLYFALFVSLLIGWIAYYRTRQTLESQQDAVSLGVVLASSFVVLSTLVLNLFICSYVYK